MTYPPSLGLRHRLLVGGVGSGERLRQCERADRLARRQPPQPLILLRAGAELAMGSATSELLTLTITDTTALARPSASSASA